MVERKILVATVIIVLMVSVAGYSVGLFSASSGETVTVTSSTTITEVPQTITTTSTSKITETVTSTTAVNRDLPIPSPANSTAIIRSHLIFNGTILITYSIDKPTYSIGEIVHIKSTITNLTPNKRFFRLGGHSPMIEVGNSTNGWVWIYPEFAYAFYVFPLPPDYINLSPGETKTIAWMTADWNMKGLHFLPERDVYNEYYVPWEREGLSLKGDFYNDYFVSEGQYNITWSTGIAYLASENWHSESLDERIPFTITKQVE